MSGNRDHEAARRYHDATRHSRESVRASAHGLDWSNKPEPFKIYPDLPVTPLPRDFPVPTMDALAAISGEVDAAAPLDLERLATATALALPARGVTGFVDIEVNGLLAVDPEKEGTLLLAPVGAPAMPAPSPPVVATITPSAIPLSEAEVDYPLLRDAYANSAL